jgi:hypothetical protein
MGWKISCLLANERQPGYLANSPEHDAVAARHLLKSMRILVTHTSSLAFLFNGIDSLDSHRRFCIGTYEGAALIAGLPDLIGTVEHKSNEIIQRFVSLYPKATVFAFDVSSSTNYFAYALYENSVLRRHVCGDAERGLVLNEGPLLEEEKEVLDKYGGQDLVKHGEALAFNLCKRFFGRPFDELDDDKLHVEIVRLLPVFFVFTRKLLRRPPFNKESRPSFPK